MTDATASLFTSHGYLYLAPMTGPKNQAIYTDSINQGYQQSMRI